MVQTIQPEIIASQACFFIRKIKGWGSASRFLKFVAFEPDFFLIFFLIFMIFGGNFSLKLFQFFDKKSDKSTKMN